MRTAFYLNILLLMSCAKVSSEGEHSASPQEEAFSLDYKLNSFEIDDALFQFDKSVIISNDLEEASGIIESRHHSAYFYKHNDSGSDARIYLYNENGAQAGQYKINGITAIDYEDIAINTEEGAPYIYLGDFGDNKQGRKSVFIYRFKEPVANQLDIYFRDTISTAQTIEYKYLTSDGVSTESLNCEALFVDPITKDIFLITKSKPAAHLYKIPFPYLYNQMNYAHRCGTFSFPPHQVTAADISSDGKQILVRTYEHVLYWNRDITKPIEQVLQEPFTRLPYVGEPQGEAICFTSSNGYVTVSEKNSSVPTKFYFFKSLYSMELASREF